MARQIFGGKTKLCVAKCDSLSELELSQRAIPILFFEREAVLVWRDQVGTADIELLDQYVQHFATSCGQVFPLAAHSTFCLWKSGHNERDLDNPRFSGMGMFQSHFEWTPLIADGTTRCGSFLLRIFPVGEHPYQQERSYSAGTSSQTTTTFFCRTAFRTRSTLH